MARPETALAPHDSLALLTSLARAGSVDPANVRKLADAKRDIVTALNSGGLLMSADDKGPATAPGGPDDGAVLAVFTDTEAAEGWLATGHPEAPPATVGINPGLDEGGTDWRELCRRHSISALAVNPAGPLGAVVYATELEGVRPRLLRRRTAPDPELAWLDLGYRADERRRAAELIRRLAATIAAGDIAAANALASEAAPINRLHSLLVSAELSRLGGRLRVRDTNWIPGLDELAVAGTRFRFAGAPHHAIDGLIETAEGLLALIADGDSDQREWAATKQAQVREVLKRLVVIGYRRDDLERLGEPGADAA